jgi:ribosomal protein S18 acetylase RimI-like enzyme
MTSLASLRPVKTGNTDINMPHTDKYLIEPIEVSDEPFLWEMLYFAVYVPPGISAPDKSIVHKSELSRYVQGWGKVNDCGIKALTDDGQAVGAVWLRLLTDKNRGYGYIDDHTPELAIAVAAEHRGKGIGTLLLKRIFVLAAKKHEAVSLNVSKDNPAKRLYNRLGFEVVCEEVSSLTMKRRIKESAP